MNIEAMIENGLTGYINSKFPNQTPAQTAIVTEAVKANTQLALMVVEIEGAKLLAKSHPDIAAAINAALGVTA